MYVQKASSIHPTHAFRIQLYEECMDELKEVRSIQSTDEFSQNVSTDVCSENAFMLYDMMRKNEHTFSSHLLFLKQRYGILLISWETFAKKNKQTNENRLKTN